MASRIIRVRAERLQLTSHCFLFFAIPLISCLSSLAQTPARIVGPILSNDRVQLPLRVRPEIREAVDLGPLPFSQTMKTLMISLARTSAQNTQLESLLQSQQTAGSPDYHRWLTPEQFGEQFGANPDDLAGITNWLANSGFQNIQVAPSRSLITVDGTAGVINSAFGTTLHGYELHGVHHFANSTPASVPKAIGLVVDGIEGLNDFGMPSPHPHQAGDGPPQFTAGTSTHYLSAEDITTIYDIPPTDTGAGVTLVIVGTANISPTDSAIAAYRTLNGLPAINLSAVNPYNDPSDNTGSTEAYLDIEIAGAVAPGATIDYVYDANLWKAIAYAINANTGSIINISFGGCEAVYSSPAREDVLQQANSQGITVIAASGDTGAAGTDNPNSAYCDWKTEKTAMYGAAVNYPASSADVTAVGGSRFDDSAGGYWVDNDGLGGSALSYIPEVAWDDIAGIWSDSSACADIGCASGGGVSTVIPLPSWQSGPGFATNGRNVPDIAFAASANHDGYLICEPAGLLPYCYDNSFADELGVYDIVGGTSAAAPLFAGVMALVNQRLSPLSPRQGNVNPRMYALAESATHGTVFHDITAGSNDVPTSSGGIIGYSAGIGYDLATGWGSLDVSAFIAAMTGEPIISSWNVSPATVPLGKSVTVSYSALDTSGAGLSRAELWRAPDNNGSPGTWTEVAAPYLLSGSGPEAVSFTDTPPSIGKYWYGTHVLDQAGNEALEPNLVLVDVTATNETLQVSVSGNGRVISGDGLINCNTSCSTSYPTGTAVTLTATPAAGRVFSNWLGCDVSTGSTCTVTLTSGKTVTATFTQSGTTYSLSVTKSGSGSVASADGYILCGSVCQHNYTAGSAVVLAAVAASGWTFSGWTGCDSPAGSNCTITMTAARQLLASFSQNATSYLLSVNKYGSGTVTSTDGYINCNAICSHSYASGTTVTLNASAASGWNFSGWSGACSGTASCTISMNAIENVTAAFSQSGSGGTIYHITGQITYNGAGLPNVLMAITGGTNGGTYTDSQGDYDVSLPAGGYNITPTLAGYVFNPAALDISLSQNITFNFTASLLTYPLTVNETSYGTGGGTVTSQPAGISCSSATCSANFNSGTTVSLTASPSAGSTFGGWSGACQGNNECSVTMSQAQTVEATFASSSGTGLLAISPGEVSTVAGDGTQGSGGDGGSPTSASLNGPHGIAEDSKGDIYIAEFDGNRIRVINTQQTAITLAGISIKPGAIATLAGNGTGAFSGDGGPASSAEIYGPTSIAFDSAGNLYFSDDDNNRVRVINLQSTPITVAGILVQPGAIETVAGNGTYGYTGDGVAATSAGLTNPQGVLVDKSGNIYIAEWERVRVVNATTGVISTYAGGGPQNCTTVVNGVSIGCLATSTLLSQITSLAMDSLGNLFLADSIGSIKEVFKAGSFPDLPTSPVAGYIYAINEYNSGCTAQSDSSGDGCSISDSPGIVAEGLAVDAGGSLYFADYGDSRVHRVDRSTGLLSAIGGDGTAGYLQDDVPATNTEISFNSYQYGSVLSIDSSANLLFSDATDQRVREISASGAPLSLLSPSVGVAGPGETISLMNAGQDAIVDPAFSVTGSNANEFSTSSTCGATLASGASCTVTVVFSPTTAGIQSANLVISGSNALNLPQIVALNGNEADAVGTFTLSSTALNFPSEQISTTSASQPITITNTGTANLAAPGFAVTGSNSGDFAAMNTCQSGIEVNQSCEVVVTFDPSGAGTRNAVLTLTDSNASNSPQTVTLTGQGTAPIQTPTVTVNLSASSITTAQPLTATITVSGTAGSPTPSGSVILTAGSYTSAVTALSAGGASISVPAGSLSIGTQTLTVSYIPDGASSSAYNDASANTTVTVTTPAKTTPTVTVQPSSSSVTTAQTLSVTMSVTGGSGNPPPTGSVTLSSGTYTSAVTLLSGGTATLNIPAGQLTAGTDTLSASYTPDSSSSSTYNSASGSAIVTVTSPPKITPTVTVQPSSSSVTTAQTLSVTMSVTGGSGNPAPTGSVTLSSGTYTSAATPLSSGSAIINIPAGKLTAGSDTLTVTYTPDSSSSAAYNSATGSVTVTVTTPAKTTPTVTVTPSASSITTEQTLAVTVAVNGGTGSLTPTGSVTLTGGGYVSAATPLSSGSATINIPANSLSAGTDSLAVSYTPDSSSSSTYNSASGSVTVTVTTPAKITPTVTVAPSAFSITTAQPLTVMVTVNGGTGNPTPSGSVTLTGGGYISAATTLSSGSATINIPANSLSVGTNSLAVSYTPDSSSSSTYNSASGSVTVTVTTPAKATPTVTVTPSASSITAAQPLTVTVTVNGGTGNATPTGTVTLSSGSYSAQQTLATGTASFTIAAGTLGNGANTLTASYSGDATYVVASSTTTVTVEPVSISTTTPAPVNPGSSTTSTLTLTGSGGYSGTMDLSCSLASSPVGAQSLPTCALNPANVTLASGGSGTSTLTVNTTAASTAALARPTDQRLWKLGGGTVLAALLFFGIPFRRRRWTSMLTLLLLVAAAGGAIGCGGGRGTAGGGGGGSSTPATTAGNYSFTVVATDSANAKIATSTTILVTVQ